MATEPSITLTLTMREARALSAALSAARLSTNAVAFVVHTLAPGIARLDSERAGGTGVDATVDLWGQLRERLHRLMGVR